MKEKRKFSLGEILILTIIIIFFLSGVLSLWSPEIPDWIMGTNNYLDVLSGFWKYLVTVLWCIDRILCIAAVTVIPTCVIHEIIWILLIFLLYLFNLLSRVTSLTFLHKLPKSDDLLKNDTYIYIVFFLMFIVTAIAEIVLQPHIEICIYLGITALVVIIIVLKLYLKYKDSQI